MVASLIASVDKKHGSPRKSHDKNNPDERSRCCNKEKGIEQDRRPEKAHLAASSQ